MLSVITGKQRAGKSYYTVTLMIDYLKSSHRFLYSNLPIQPDFLCNYICNKKRSKLDYYMCRIFLFLPDKEISEGVFKIPLSEYKHFAKKNPHFLRNHFQNLIPESRAKSFWNWTRNNSVIFLDEVYELFSCQNYKDKNLTDWRVELMKYSRQHGHRGDDLFLISHNYQDLDSFLRRGIQYLYLISNSKYTNIFENKIMRGLKYPIQFFIVEGFEFGEVVPSDRFHVYPKKEIFKCYESFSAPKGLGEGVIIDRKDLPYYDPSLLDGFESTDTGVNFKANMKRFLKQFMPWIIFGSAIISAVIFGLYKMRSFMSSGASAVSSTLVGKPDYSSKNSKVTSALNSDIVDSNCSSGGVGSKNQIPEKKEKFIPPTIKGITPTCVYWSDGFKMRLGDIYQGLQIEKITKNFILVSSNGKRFKVSLSGSRNFEKESR